MPLLVTAWLLFVTNSQDVRALAQSAIASMRAKDFARVEAQFDEKMKGALPAGRLEAIWNGLAGQFGALKDCKSGEARVVAVADKQMVITPCELERAKVNVQFAFDSAGHISGLNVRPAAAAAAAPYSVPSYATPSAYTESELRIGSGEWTLPGTLTLPNGAGPFPALVLVHGSGPNDRDETLGPNKPFADLAAGLASRGIAVLRYDKRTRVYGPQMAALKALTVKDEVVDDAIAAAAVLRTQPEIDKSRVFVLGHSLGGMLVPRIAAADAKLAGAIVMAGAARPLEDAIVEQTKYLAAADGSISPDEQNQIDEMSKTAAQIRAITPADAAAGTRVFNAPASYWLDLKGYDAPSAARALTLPMLVLQGERDYQVTMDEFARWKTALAGRANVTFHSYPALNHLFQSGTGKSGPAEYDRPSRVAEQVVVDIAAWMKR
jgi:dienelactone hydrolase